MPQPGVFEAAKADSTQSFVAVGHQGALLRTNPDYLPVQLLNEVLSGGFTSRLFGKIRTELGLAYSVGGGLGANWTRVAPFQMHDEHEGRRDGQGDRDAGRRSQDCSPRPSRPPTPR